MAARVRYADYSDPAEHAEMERQNKQRTPRLAALIDDLAAHEREHPSPTLFLLLENMRYGLGHACYEVTPEEDAALRRAWNLVALVVSR
jgi:hypothetical protein